MTLATQAIPRTRHMHHAIPLVRLLWKEFSERRWWAISWALLLLAFSLFAHGQSFCGDSIRLLAPWKYLPYLLAGIVGLGGFSGELLRGRALFLFARPVRWLEVVLAKVLFGAIISVGISLLTAVIFRLTCPEPYRQFVTLPNVLAGVGALAWPAILCYLGGLVCSVILPGLGGSVLTVAALGITVFVTLLSFGLVVFLIVALCAHFKLISTSELMEQGLFAGIVYSTIPGLIWGMLLAARSGLYRDYPRRILLFVPKLILTMLIGGLLGFCLPPSLAEQVFLRWYPQVGGLISRNGSYAIVSYQQRFTMFGVDANSFGPGFSMAGFRTDLIRLSDHAVLRRTTSEQPDDVLNRYDWSWITDTVAFGHSRKANGNVLYHANTDIIIPVTDDDINNPSPNNRYALSIRHNVDSNTRRKVCLIHIYNLDNGHMASQTIPIDSNAQLFPFWWESNDVIGYCRQERIKVQGEGQRMKTTYRKTIHLLRVPKF